MKLNYIIILVACCLFSFPACNDFLEENPSSQFPSEGFYKDKQTLEAGLYGVYQAYRGLPLYLSVLTNAGTDIAKPYRSSPEFAKICTYTFTSEHVYFESIWADLYTIIMRANIIIRVCKDADFLEEGDRQKIMSEALFLRAHAYYYLVCFWGDVPLITTPMEKFDYTLPRVPLNEVYQQMVEDLEYAAVEGRLPEERRSDQPARISRYAAKGLLGKVYLTMASYKESGKVQGYERITESVQQLYQKANRELTEVILASSFDLVTPYSAAFEISEKSRNTEALFEIYFGPGELGSGWSRDAYGGYGNGNGIDLRLYGSYCGKRNLLPVGSFVRTYQTGDNRYHWNIQDSTIVLDNGVWSREKITNVESMFIPKFRQGEWNEILTHGYAQCENNYPVLRYADILLMYAETELKLNGGNATANAVREVNRIIQRARYPKTEAETPDFPDYTQHTLTFDALMQERARELCYEPHRKIDLLRTGLLEEALEKSSYTDPLTSFRPFHYLYPIPAYEIRLTRNPTGFYQNPGYGKGAENE